MGGVQGAAIGQSGAHPQQGCMGGDSSHAPGVEDFCWDKSPVLLFQLLTDLLHPGQADRAGPNMSVLSDPQP